MRRLALVLLVLGCGSPPAPKPEPPTHVTTSDATEPPVDAGIDVAPPPPPPYDLVADRARIVDVAHDELGASVPATVVQDAFVLVAAPGWIEAALQASKSLATRAIDAYFNGRFDKRPARAVGVYLFPDGKTYQAYCRARLGGDCPSVFGFYRPDLRRIIMNAGPGLGTLTHELVHPIVESDFPQAPTWINEGIASLFEAPMIPKRGEIHGGKNWRHPRLLRGLASPAERGEARLDRYFTMPDEQFREHHEDLHWSSQSQPDLQRVLEAGLAQLPEVQRSVVLLRDLEGYSYEEIAELTGLNLTQVKVYIYRGRTALKDYIGKLELVL